MQLNRTYMTFDDVMEYILPTFIFRIYSGVKKAYTTSQLFANLFIINLFMLFFKESNEENHAYRRIWSKQNSRTESKDVDEDTCSIRPFKINVQESILGDLKSRLGRTRLCNSSNNSESRLSSTHLRKLIDYWSTEFDWGKREHELNKFPHFKTRIGNTDMHFLHFKTNQLQNPQAKTIPLLLIHNWPGSFADFHKVIPILQTYSVKHGFAFELVCPSMPGCGFTETSLQEDFSARKFSEILLALMDRLGLTEFYVHGYGWGAVTASLIARYYPYRVKGMHVNMCFALPNLFDSFIRTLIVSICPFFINTTEYNIIFPLKKKIKMLIKETGFLHIQCTKPDSLGCVVADSPIALLIQILEKFHFKKNSDHLQLQDGGLTEKNMDDLLILVTILWINNDFTNGARFFKEIISNVLQRTHENGISLTVPCGIAFFPEEIFMLPKYMMENLVENLVSYTIMPRGGHLAALEEPLLLAKDICKFVQAVENLSSVKSNE